MTDREAMLAAAAAFLDDAAATMPLANREFWTRGRDGHLRFQRCMSCGYLRFPSAEVCPECWSTDAEWSIDSGLGTVWSHCTYHRAFSPRFRDAVPYQVCLVELDSGPRLLTNPLSAGGLPVRIGVRGRVRPVPVGELALPYFEPEED